MIGFVFARGGSKGIPRKNLQRVDGTPLVGHAVDDAQACPEIDRVILSTDDPEIARIVREGGADVPFMRPAELAEDDTPEWLAWQHAIRTTRDASEALGLFVSIPPTAPLRRPSDISRCIEKLRATDADIVVTVRPADRSPYFNMVEIDPDGRARRVLESDDESIRRRQDAPSVCDMTTVAYAADPDFVLDATGIFDGVVRAVEVPESRSLDIDTEMDLRIARCLASDQTEDYNG